MPEVVDDKEVIKKKRSTKQRPLASDVNVVSDNGNENPDDENTVQAEPEKVSGSVVEEEEERKREEALEKAQKELEALDPQTKAKRWMIGKPPEYGGGERDYAIYVQEKLPWMARQKFFSLVGRTMATAIKASGGDVGGMSDVFGDDGGSLIERGRRLTSRDFSDASSFMALAFELVGYAPNFLSECYCIWLNVPRLDRDWARERFNEPWNPEADDWGLKDEDHEEIINTFIDQNYEEIRRFFAEVLPRMAKRISLHERGVDRKTQDRKSK